MASLQELRDRERTLSSRVQEERQKTIAIERKFNQAQGQEKIELTQERQRQRKRLEEVERQFNIARERVDLQTKGFTRVGGVENKKDSRTPINQTLTVSGNQITTTQTQPVIKRESIRTLKSSRRKPTIQDERLLQGFSVQTTTPGTQTQTIQNNPISLKSQASFEAPGRQPQVFFNSSIPENFRSALELNSNVNQFSLNPFETRRAVRERVFEGSIRSLQNVRTGLENSETALGRTAGTNFEVLGRAGAFGAGVGTGLTNLVESGVNFERKPAESISNIPEGLTRLPSALRLTGQELSRGDPFTTGRIVGELTGPSIAVKGLTIGQNVFVRTGARFVDPRDVFDPKVLSGSQRFPEASSIDDSLNLFGRSNIVTTSAPSKISGKTAGSSRKGELGLEDSGIFVTPEGKGSPAFLRIEEQSLDFSLNPFKAIPNFGIPTVTRFETQGVQRLPREVISQPGFSSIDDFFLSEGSKTGQAFITKRSEIGQGEIPRQIFASKQDFDLNFPLTVQREGQRIKTKNIKEGDLITEAGTKELEAVIPLGARFETQRTGNILSRLKGFEEFTTLNGRNIPLRNARVLSSIDDDLLSLGKTNKNLISGRKIKSGQDSLSSFARNSKTITPRSFIRPLSNTESINSALNSRRTTTSVLDSKSVARSQEESLLNLSAVSPLTSNLGSRNSPLTGGKSGSSSILSSGIGSFGGGSSSILLGKFDNIPAQTARPITFDSKKNKAQPKVNVFVREFGKEIKINKKPLPLNKAKRLGAEVVDNTARASFEIRSATKKALQETTAPKKFFGRKTKTGLFFKEYNEFRIDTPGEKKELSVAKYLKDRGFKL